MEPVEVYFFSLRTHRHWFRFLNHLFLWQVRRIVLSVHNFGIPLVVLAQVYFSIKSIFHGARYLCNISIFSFTGRGKK